MAPEVLPATSHRPATRDLVGADPGDHKWAMMGVRPLSCWSPRAQALWSVMDPGIMRTSWREAGFQKPNGMAHLPKS